MFRLVMNPKMKNSAVTVINGKRYPGDVRAADCFCCVAIEGFSPLPQKILARFGRFPASWPKDRSQDDRRYTLVGLPWPRNPGFFAAHNTIRKTPRWGSDCQNG
jgi:hypothetical protein